MATTFFWSYCGQKAVSCCVQWRSLAELRIEFGPPAPWFNMMITQQPDLIITTEQNYLVNSSQIRDNWLITQHHWLARSEMTG